MNFTPLRTSRCTYLSALAGVFLLGGCTSQQDLIAAGRLERGLPRDSGGHIDVTVIAPDGVTVYDAQVKYRAETSSAGTPKPRHGSLRRAHTRYGSYGVYSVRFPGLPPDGSVVRVRHEPDTHPASDPKP